MGQEVKKSPVVLETRERSEGAENERKPEDNATLSANKLSAEQLICKTPRESPNVSLKSFKNEDGNDNKKFEKGNESVHGWLLYLGTTQILLGLLMATFGVLAIMHSARLGQIGGGLWGGCLAVASGTMGVLAAAKNWCPLTDSAQKVAHTAFLALSLIGVAVSQLILVIAATGLARDLNRSDVTDEEQKTLSSSSEEPHEISWQDYMTLMANTGLLIVSGIHCVCAAVSSYKSSRALCPCFRDRNEVQGGGLQVNTKDAFVHSWLGKHALPSPFYVVAATPANSGKRNRYAKNLALAPVLSMPPPPPIMNYPLLPAPLGPIPSPMIRPHLKEYMKRKRKRQRLGTPPKKLRKPKPRSKQKERPVTTEEVIRTYTGLDRAIAEEFIEMCDLYHTSLCSESACSCQSSSCDSHNRCTACTSISNSCSDSLKKK